MASSSHQQTYGSENEDPMADSQLRYQQSYAVPTTKTSSAMGVRNSGPTSKQQQNLSA